jgi:hypothetical protein
MKSLKTLLLTKSIIAAGGLVASIGTASAATPELLGSPSAGVICRAGYTSTVVGAAFKCSKTSSIKVDLSCTDPKLTKYVARAAGSGGSPDGLDICVKDNPKVNIGSTDDISGLTKGVDYVFAKADQTKITEKTNTQDQTEATALGLAVGEVDTVAGEPVVKKNDNGIVDKAEVPITYFTFAIKTGGFTGGSLPFAPRPLP